MYGVCVFPMTMWIGIVPTTVQILSHDYCADQYPKVFRSNHFWGKTQQKWSKIYFGQK